MLEFNLPTNDVPLSTIFLVLQKAQSALYLQDYSVSQTTLDQVNAMPHCLYQLTSLL